MRKVTLLISLLILSMLLIFIPGCVTNRVSLVDTHQVTVTKQDSDKIRILWTDVYQQDGQTWVYGVLKQKRPSTSTIKTHIDVQVLAPDDSVQYETASKDIYVPRNRVGKGINWKKVRVQLPNELPKYFQIIMTVHSAHHENKT